MANNFIVVFDLDDTLYYEFDFLKSAYLEIANNLSTLDSVNESVSDIYQEMMLLFKQNKNTFAKILLKYNIKEVTVNDLLNRYRNHIPLIKLSDVNKSVLDFLKTNKILIGIITDGRSLQQRNKIKSLGLNKYVSDIIISEEFGSEKPSLMNYLFFEKKYKSENTRFMYIGDNLTKDFVTPNKLGWVTICLNDGGKNIHSQKIQVSSKYLPQIRINSLEELIRLIKNI